MRIAAGITGLCLIAVIMWEAFEVIVLPRRVARKWRITRFFYRIS